MPALYGASLLTADGEEFILDATPTIEISRDADATSYEVEEGADITDHVRVQARALSVSAVLSDTPGYEAPAVGRASAQLDRLHQLMLARQPLTLISALEVVERVIITGLQASRGSTTSWTVSLDLQEIRTAATATAEIPLALLKPKAKPKGGAADPKGADQGTQTGTPATPEGAAAGRKSVAKGGLDSILNLVNGGG